MIYSSQKLWNLASAILIVSLVVLVAFKSKESQSMNKGLVPSSHMDHIGIVVDDIESSLDKWLELLGQEERPPIIIADGHEDNPTHYRGVLSDAKARLAFIPLENLRIELIEPMGEAKSHWKEFLSQHGPVVHHAGFTVNGLGETYIDLYKKEGYSLAQHGGWDGGEYGYMDTQENLGMIIELLEHYQR